MDVPDPGEGFAEAFDRYSPAILGYARRRLDSPEAAWDVVSDTFTAAWRHWDQRLGADDLLPWLYAIAGNAVRDQRRSDVRRRRLTARLAAAGSRGQVADPADGVVQRRSIGDALARLPEADREILRLVAWEGQADARALGLVLGLSPVTVRSRVHRARRRLRALLDNEAGVMAAAVTETAATETAVTESSVPRADTSGADVAAPPPASPVRQHIREA